MHTAHKIAFTWILYVLHYMYFNQFHFSISASLHKFLALAFILPSFMWPILYTCTANQANFHSKKKKNRFAILLGSHWHVWYYNIDSHVHSHRRNHWWWNTHISCVDRFRFHFRHFQFSNCYYLCIHLLNLHQISLYFSIGNPTKCHHSAIYAYLQDARRTYSYLHYT